MHIATIDHIANSGDSIIHGAKTVSKILMSIFLLTSVIIANDLIRLSIMIGIIAGLFLIARISIKEIIHLVLYPIFFSALFAVFKINESWAAAAVIILKSLGAALSMLLLISTTSYVEIFALLSSFLPGVLVDIFVFTYRTLFILIDVIGKMILSIRIRGGYSYYTPIRNIKNITGVIGVMLIHSLDMSERMYRVYVLRGYSGGMKYSVDSWPLEFWDCVIIVFSILLLVGMVIPWSL